MNVERGAPPTIVAETELRCRICAASAACCGTKRGRFLKQHFAYYRCSNCGFLFVEPVTDFRIYDDAYYAGRGPDPLVNYEKEYQQYSATDRLLEFEDLFSIAQKHVASRAAKQISWLDFGCGAGGLLKYLRDRAEFDLNEGQARIDIVGHDLGTYADRLRTADGFNILDWGELTLLPNDRFDIISCIEVLEHVPNAKPVLQLLSRLLRPGGLLLLTTGNLSSPLAKIRNIYFSYCIPEIHVSLFNPELLASLYREVGLVPKRMRYHRLIQFRILKTLRSSSILNWFSILTRLPITRWIADYLYGTSAMPCAIKPDAPGRG